MYITINRKLPYPMELEYFDDVKFDSLKDLYKTLSMESDTILLSPFNLKKIITYFNDKNNIMLLNKELLAKYGLTDLVTSDSIFITDFNCANQYLNGISTTHPMNIINDELSLFISQSKKDFLDYLKSSNNKNLMSRHSLRSEDNIEIIELENRSSTIYLKLKAEYILEQIDFSHFDYYKTSRIHYIANVNQYNKTKVHVEKYYQLKLNKDNKNE